MAQYILLRAFLFNKNLIPRQDTACKTLTSDFYWPSKKMCIGRFFEDFIIHFLLPIFGRFYEEVCNETQSGTAQCKPSEEFELTAYSIGAHIETHGGLILRTLS